MNNPVIWKLIPGFEEYQVSEHGDVRKGSKLLKPERVSGSGRKRFSLSKAGRVHRFHAAHLVAFAFIGPKPSPEALLCHKDDFEHNNHFTNLRWDTTLANAADASLHRLQRAERSLYPRSRSERLNVEAALIVAAGSSHG